jgi:hypothetical protein
MEIKSLLKELMRKDVLMRSDFRGLADTTVKAILALPESQRPPVETYRKIEKLVGGEAYLNDGFRLLLVRLAYAYSEATHFSHWLGEAIDAAEIHGPDALKAFPNMKVQVVEIVGSRKEAADRQDSEARKALRDQPPAAKLSTRQLKSWPQPAMIKELIQSASLLNWAVNGDFEIKWDVDFMKGVEYGLVKNGLDQMEFFMTSKGCVCVGLSHDSEMVSEFGKVWPQLLTGLPDDFAKLKKVIFGNPKNLKELSFCVWYSNPKKSWGKGTFKYSSSSRDADGSQSLWFVLPLNAKEAAQRYSWYLGKKLNPRAIKAVYQRAKPDSKLLSQLNPESPRTISALKKTKLIRGWD